MRVFRRRYPFGFLALLALVVQAVVAFAHTHTHTSVLARADDLAARAITYGMCRASADQPCPPQAPHHDESNCPICWSLSMASAAVLQAPPAIPLRYTQVGRPAPAHTVARLIGSTTVHFQARAPPLA